MLTPDLLEMAIEDEESLKWYPWYWHEFDKSTRGWPLIARAIYRELLDFQWADGSLPAEDERLRMLVTASPDEWKIGWPLAKEKFPIERAGVRQNPAMQRVRTRQIEKLREKSKQNSANAKKRWQGKDLDATGMRPQCESMLERERDLDRDSDKDSELSKNTTSVREKPQLVGGAENRSRTHARIRDAYWKTVRQDWSVALHHLERVLSSGASEEFILAQMQKQIAYDEATGSQPMRPSRWFGDPDKPWQNVPEIPTKKKRESNFARVTQNLEDRINGRAKR